MTDSQPETTVDDLRLATGGRLAGKVAIITGAGSGFGAAIAHRFASEGARVVVADVDETAGRNTAGAVRGLFMRTDVTRDEDWASVVGTTLDAFGGLDVVVNNAGWTHAARPILELSVDDLDRVMALHVRSALLSARYAAPVMRRGTGGTFVNVGSSTATRPRAGLALYGASKAALEAITKSLALELAADGIRANCVAPGWSAETGLSARFVGHEPDEAVRERVRASVPLRRLTTPSDVANACVYLASDEAQGITGIVLPVDGGRSL